MECWRLCELCMREFHKSIEKICDAVQTAGLTKEKYAIYVSSTSINISVSFGFRVFSVFPHILSLYCYLLLLFVLFAFTALSIFDVVCPLNCAFLSRKRMLQETQDDYQKKPIKIVLDLDRAKNPQAKLSKMGFNMWSTLRWNEDLQIESQHFINFSSLLFFGQSMPKWCEIYL